MLQGKCAQCGASDSVALFLGVDGRLLCRRCAAQVVEQAKAKRAAVEIVSIIDPTVCYQCKTDYGSQELPLIGGLPFCARCAPSLYARPFPPWLKLTLAGLLVLLGLALMHGNRYFKAGKALVLGERLVAARQYEPAIPQLQAALAIAPDCEKAVLLLGKADLLTGRYQEANKVLAGHKGGQFKEGPLAAEVRRTFERVDKGLGKAADARKLFEADKSAEAARAYHEAAALLPEARGLADAVDGLDAVAAFDQKDYDTFLAIAEKGWKNHSQSSDYAGALASALACKYAVTGDPAFRTRTEEMLEKARQLAASSPEAMQRNKEYEERTRYRLKTRKILDPKEYDRQFHPEKSKPVK
ncbi:MAG: tetratricopeptide repeat protein [Terriglobia bacterium]